MKRILCLIIVVVILSIFPVAATTVSFVETNQNTLAMNHLGPEFREYSELYLSRFIHDGIRIQGESLLYDMITSEPIAIVYDLSSGGYAIFDVRTLSVSEFSASSFNPYAKVLKNNQIPYYYGAGNYFTKKGNEYIDLYSGNVITMNQVTKSMNENAISRASILSNPDTATRALENKEKLLVTRSSYVTGGLTRALSTDWVNFKCGPTSIYNMLEFRGELMLYPTRTPIRHINYIASFTGNQVSLSSLKNGTNSYLSTAGSARRVSSCSYSFARVMAEINANRPITLGTSPFAGNDGHVNTIHGYVRTLNDHYVLYVNDSHGNNNVAYTYEITPPSHFADHVYYTN
jgi:hypothetical protein